MGQPTLKPGFRVGEMKKVSAMPMEKKFAAVLFLILLFAAFPAGVRSETPGPGADASLSLSNLAVSEEIGKVQERFTGRSSRTIIQIQDVHAHAIAQQNIAAILERLRTVFGVKTVALEGAWASTSLPKSHAIPTSREKQLLAGTLLEDDLISGPVYAAIMSPDPISLVGVEDSALYEKNRSIFVAHLEKKQEIQEKLRAYGATLADSQKSVWEPGLLAFGNAFGKFRETTDLGKFFPVLMKTAESHSIALTDLAQITLLRDIMALEKTVLKENLEQEIKSLMQEYKNTPWTLEELIRDGRIPAEKLGSYPGIKKLTRLYQMRDQIFLRDLTTQVETLTSRVLEKLVKTPEEKALWEKTGRFYLAKRILLLQATPSDMTAYKSEKSSLESELAGAGLLEGLALSLVFYETVKKRDEIFFEKIMTDPSLTGNIAIVTGGFHTDGLSQKFRDAGISYITITPELGGASMNEKLYEKRMAEPLRDRVSVTQRPGLKRADDQTLSELRNRIDMDEDFPPAFEILKQTRDIRRAEVRFTGNAASISNSSRIARGDKGRGAVDVSELIKPEFTTLFRADQLEKVREVLEFASVNSGHVRAALVTDVDAINKLFSLENVPALVRQLFGRGDFLVFPEGESPVTMRLPEDLHATHGVKLFKAVDLKTLLTHSQEFRQFAMLHPYAITVMRNGTPPSTDFVVLPETPEAFVLYWLIAQDRGLYRNARKPEFLQLLLSLVAEIQAQELPKKSV
jgi:hypothetical protein